MEKRRLRPRKLLELAVIVLTPIIAALYLQLYTPHRSGDTVSNRKDAVCTSLEALQSDFCRSACGGFTMGFPFSVEADDRCDEYDEGFMFTLLLNVGILTVPAYSLVAVSTYIRRKYYGQAADGSPIIESESKDEE